MGSHCQAGSISQMFEQSNGPSCHQSPSLRRPQIREHLRDPSELGEIFATNGNVPKVILSVVVDEHDPLVTVTHRW
ncbi:unnamed protein product [Fusarium graminearum]|uniref:Chromosome 2, complete genome n=1 Tax=Gibberella zeae (strain ATCC MYA-4620 / CBS 123657 / FGSC 9075 / NRRL 31084 / PH-1) TaxID=229533 RepID=A0A098DFF6_GIBZE|nr:unnamed protein product [Fusarium graminearum]CZS79978.1 unnamed protein product [Fusarium graminearum]